MSGIWVLLSLILISSIPVIAVYVWFRLAKYQFSFILFLFPLLAGAAAFFPALLMQSVLVFPFQNSRTALFFHHFVRIALTEELSRLLLLFIFFWISTRVSASIKTKPLSFNVVKKAAAIGLVAGFGFALLENAVYAASDINVLPLRIIITAAIHGTCGARIGSAAVMLRYHPVQAFLRILTAVAIHGIYNMLITMSGFSLIIAILIAISTLINTFLTIRGGWSEDASQSNVNTADASTAEMP